MAATDPAIALALWRAVRERLYREHPQSPVPADARATFQAHHFDHDPSLRFEVVVDARRRRPTPGAFAARAARTAAPTRCRSRASGGRRSPSPSGARTPVGLLDGGLRGRPVPPVPRRDERHRDVRRRPLPGRRGQERGPRRRPGRRHARRSTSTSRSSRRAPSIRSGRVRWRRPRTGSTSRSAPANASPDDGCGRRPPHHGPAPRGTGPNAAA